MRFGILGSFEARDDRGGELDLGGPKQRAVLAILLLHRGEVVSGDRLSDELWGERAPRTATKTIQVYVSHLRRALGEAMLATRAGGYALCLDAVQIDRDRFEALAALGREALQAGHAGAAAAHLREALGLWRGSPLVDFTYEPFAQSEIARLEEARLCALEDRIEADLGCGDHAALVAELEVLVREHPLRDRLRAQLMLALYRAGRPSEALECYTSARHALVNELGIEPGKRLRELHQAILEQDPALDPPVGSPGQRGASSGGPSNLPLRPRRLVGRGREVTELCEMLTGGADPLVTVAGIGGSGKTRLAVAVGSELRRWAFGGVFFVALAATREGSAILPMIGEAVGLTGASEHALFGALARRLGDQPTLLILDNFEQLLDAAPLISDLSAEAPELRMLVTSRIPMRLSAERVFTLGGLDRGDSVALFLERARARDRRFEATDGDLEAVGRICDLLDDTPLAIELAAGRAQMLGLAELRERLVRPLALLTRSDRDVPERQQSLRATIDWTFALLDPRQRQLFARLGVFAGPAPLAAVEAIAQTEIATALLDDIESLMEISLVRRDTDQRHGSRFVMPQALRHYATERLRESGEEDTIRRRHAEYVLTVVHAGRLWKCGAAPGQRAALAALVAEIRPAIAWARVNEPVLHVGLCAATGFFWICRGVISETQDELRAAVESEEGSMAERAWVLTLLAKCLQLTGSGHDAGPLAERALEAWRRVGDDTERAIGLTSLSWVYKWLPRLREAVALAEEALEPLHRSNDRELTLRGLIHLAQALVEVADLERAEALVEEAALLSGGDPVYELDAIRADIAELRGDRIGAVRYYARAFAWSSAAGEAHQSLMDLHGIAVNLAHTGYGEAAIEVIELRRVQQARTGRLGEEPLAGTNMIEDAAELAREGVGADVAQAARNRARALPQGEVAQRALLLAEGAVGAPGATGNHPSD